MKRYVLTGFLLLLYGITFAQTDAILLSIEKNNKELQTLRALGEAQKLGHQTEASLPDPELGFDYLWGDPSDIGVRKDFSLTQHLDWGTLFGTRNAMAKAQNAMVDAQYEVEQRRLLLEARLLCVNLVYNRKVYQVMEDRLSDAELMVKAYASKLENGETDILAYHKAQMNLSSVTGKLKQVKIERQFLLDQLALLNGGEPISFDVNDYAPESLPENMDAFCQERENRHPLIGYAMAENQYGERHLKLSRTEAWPSLSAGYMGEWVSEENYQGLTLGLSVPLWNGRNKVKQAKALDTAHENQLENVRIQLHGKINALFEKANGLKQVAEEGQAHLTLYNDQDLLKKALDAGQISLLEYLTEINLYYEMVDQWNETERDYRLALTELWWY